MEVRFSNVSISAGIVVKDQDDAQTELPTLPTLPNALMKPLRGIVAKKAHGEEADPAEHVQYNGTPGAELRRVLPQFVSYIPQRDKHYALLTAKETLAFAHACCGGELSKYWTRHLVHGDSDENAEAVKSVRAMYRHFPDIVIKQLGLEDCQNTVVGDEMLRGVSGGERKRVTTGEMEFGNTLVKMMDEISTDLDSAATFDILAMERSVAKKFHKTVVISLLQPSPEFAHAFKRSSAYERIMKDLGDSVAVNTVERMKTLTKDQPEFDQPFWSSTVLLMTRQMTMVRRDMSGLASRLGMNVLMGFLNGCAFYQVDPADPQLVVGIVFEASLCLALALLAQIPGVIAARDLYWINPVGWGVRALAVNQYTESRFDTCVPTRDDIALSVTPDSTKQFVPVTVAFKDLWYTVPDPANPNQTIDLLKGISGYALPGTITALMGSTGAGKTTLMDVIAGRKTGGKVRGQILLNGYPATDLAIRRPTGYCEQMDIHSQSSTFREALTFSAFLRQGADVPDSYKHHSVNTCLELLDLTPIADRIIRGSSVEQMKRLTIGVELAAHRVFSFWMSQRAVWTLDWQLIMDGVRKVAKHGMLLLKRGGETVFAGELGHNAQTMIDYFEAIDDVEKLPSKYNPASWMLDVIGAGVGNNSGNNTDFVSMFKSSTYFKRLESNLNSEGVSRPSSSIAAL
ncbi:unnamed protein product [Phytophthora lilii]|uniref:Unnamed protein product n=1 Tax=Phytophthora lilii TaxID=2077276 RepID=A0A9W6UCJ4_9STRA|nr:unnamed protein product [Phytophthora lilii]